MITMLVIVSAALIGSCLTTNITLLVLHILYVATRDIK
jgi:hypothetical protein